MLVLAPTEHLVPLITRCDIRHTSPFTFTLGDKKTRLVEPSRGGPMEGTFGLTEGLYICSLQNRGRVRFLSLYHLLNVDLTSHLIDNQT